MKKCNPISYIKQRKKCYFLTETTWATNTKVVSGFKDVTYTVVTRKISLVYNREIVAAVVVKIRVGCLWIAVTV